MQVPALTLRNGAAMSVRKLDPDQFVDAADGKERGFYPWCEASLDAEPGDLIDRPRFGDHALENAPPAAESRHG